VRALAPSNIMEIRSGGMSLDGIEILGVLIFEAADRPDRLEALLAAPRGRGADALDRIQPGGSIRALMGASPARRPSVLFEGRTERVIRGSRAGSRGVTVVAYAEYQDLRAGLEDSTHRQSTDGEIAEEIARGLGLLPVVEHGGPIHEVVVRRGDPLGFLRGRARERGFELAVSAGKLYFGSEFPEMGEPYPADASAAFEEIEGAGGEREARIAVRGDPRLRPLSPVWVNGRRFTALRVLHRIDARGWSSEAHLVRPRRASGRAAAAPSIGRWRGP
jgi:hypothetical protein